MPLLTATGRGCARHVGEFWWSVLPHRRKAIPESTTTHRTVYVDRLLIGRKNEKAKLMTELQKNRRDRRYWKNRVDEYQPFYTFQTESKEFKALLEQLKQILGKVRKAENYLENRAYKPKAKKNQGQ